MDPFALLTIAEELLERWIAEKEHTLRNQDNNYWDDRKSFDLACSDYRTRITNAQQSPSS